MHVASPQRIMDDEHAAAGCNPLYNHGRLRTHPSSQRYGLGMVGSLVISHLCVCVCRCCAPADFYFPAFCGSLRGILFLSLGLCVFVLWNISLLPDPVSCFCPPSGYMPYVWVLSNKKNVLTRQQYFHGFDWSADHNPAYFLQRELEILIHQNRGYFLREDK